MDEESKNDGRAPPTFVLPHRRPRRRTYIRVIIPSTITVLACILFYDQVSVLGPLLNELLNPVQHLQNSSDSKDKSSLPLLATSDQQDMRLENGIPSLADETLGAPSHFSSKRTNPRAINISQRMRGKFVLLGDSITQLSFSATQSGWGAHLADVYQRRADIMNRGFSGYNTDWFLKYASTPEGQLDIWDLENMQLVTIFFGANDSSDAVLNPRHHVPLDRFEQNLRTIATLCRDNFGPNVRIIFITPPPVHHESRIQYQIQRYGVQKATGKLERTLELSGLYADVVCKVAKDLQAPCLHLWKEMQDSSPSESVGDTVDNQPWGQYLSDGLHLSRLGNTFLAERLVQLIHQSYPDIAVHPCSITGYTANSSSSSGKALVAVGPWHDHIDHLDAEAAFNKRSLSEANNIVL